MTVKMTGDGCQSRIPISSNKSPPTKWNLELHPLQLIFKYLLNPTSNLKFLPKLSPRLKSSLLKKENLFCTILAFTVFIQISEGKVNDLNGLNDINSNENSTCFSVNLNAANQFDSQVRRLMKNQFTDDTQHDIWEFPLIEADASDCQNLKQKLQHTILNLTVSYALLKNEHLNLQRQVKTENLVNTCVESYLGGNFDGVRSEFSKLDYSNSIQIFTNRIYAATQGDVPNLTKFVNSLDNLKCRVKMFSALVTRMNKEGIKLLKLEPLADELNRITDAVADPGMKSLFDAAKILMNELILEWMVLIATGTENENFHNLYLSELSGVDFGPILKIIDLADKLPSSHLIFQVYRNLYMEMERNNNVQFMPVMRMAQKLHILQLLYNSEASALFRMFPLPISAIFTKNVCIKDISSEFYIMETFFEQTFRGKAVVRSRTYLFTVDDSYRWVFESSHDAKFFHIRNVRSGRYLHRQDDLEPHFVTISADQSMFGGNWVLRDIDWMNGVFDVINAGDGSSLLSETGGKALSIFAC